MRNSERKRRLNRSILTAAVGAATAVGSDAGISTALVEAVLIE